jgi:hypothetical protein
MDTHISLAVQMLANWPHPRLRKALKVETYKLVTGGWKNTKESIDKPS